MFAFLQHHTYNPLSTVQAQDECSTSSIGSLLWFQLVDLVRIYHFQVGKTSWGFHRHFYLTYVARFLATQNQTSLKNTDKPTCPETRESGPNNYLHMYSICTERPNIYWTEELNNWSTLLGSVRNLSLHVHYLTASISHCCGNSWMKLVAEKPAVLSSFLHWSSVLSMPPLVWAIITASNTWGNPPLGCTTKS